MGHRQASLGTPCSQNAGSSPRAQGALGLGLAEKQKGKCGAPRSPIACGLGRCVAIDWMWVSLLPHAASATARLDKSLHAETGHDYLRSWRPTVGFLPVINAGGRKPPLYISLLGSFFLPIPTARRLLWRHRRGSRPRRRERLVGKGLTLLRPSAAEVVPASILRLPQRLPVGW